LLRSEYSAFWPSLKVVDQTTGKEKVAEAAGE